jgi:hypothetical protein
VLLNQVGVTAANPVGSLDTGFTVTFSDTAANGSIDTATAGGGTVTGAWQPDGRNVSPPSSGSVLDSTRPTALLSSFDGLNPNGAWTLYVADVSPGGIGTLESWGLMVSGATASVPESSPGFAGLLTLAFTALWPALRLRRPAAQAKAEANAAQL